jgi:SpoVK/Ycf46/Vps4 family AAA+-type ATPase
MVSVKNLIPSSARSTASAAAPLPAHLVPLLANALERTTAAIDRALPPAKKRSVLEDAEWETDDPAEGSYEKELRLQEFEASRVYRPRLIIHGDEGLGQSYLASAVLHHLEGFHVQSMDLATLLGDSTRTLEAAIVQLFIEAKRHKPAVLFIPSLTQWVNTVTETARSTFKSLLDSLAPSDPVLLLAVVDGNVIDIPRDVKAWFGHAKENRVALTLPSLVRPDRSTIQQSIRATLADEP